MYTSPGIQFAFEWRLFSNRVFFFFDFLSHYTAVRLVEFHYSLMELTKVNTPPPLERDK